MGEGERERERKGLAETERGDRRRRKRGGVCRTGEQFCSHEGKREREGQSYFGAWSGKGERSWAWQTHHGGRSQFQSSSQTRIQTQDHSKSEGEREDGHCYQETTLNWEFAASANDHTHSWAWPVTWAQ